MNDLDFSESSEPEAKKAAVSEPHAERGKIVLSQNERSIAFTSMGHLNYLSTLNYVDGVVGNSSSYSSQSARHTISGWWLLSSLLRNCASSRLSQA